MGRAHTLNNSLDFNCSPGFSLCVLNRMSLSKARQGNYTAGDPPMQDTGEVASEITVSFTIYCMKEKNKDGTYG